MSLSHAEAARLLHVEAHALDTRDWDGWLDLYTDDATYWVPAWKSEAEPTADPDTEISLIYYAGRSSLADRVWRLKSGLSIASLPLRRTSHAVTNILLDDAGETPVVAASFCTHVFDPRRRETTMLFGRYEHRLREVLGRWKICGKKILLMNDHIPTVADFYML